MLKMFDVHLMIKKIVLISFIALLLMLLGCTNSFEKKVKPSSLDTVSIAFVEVKKTITAEEVEKQIQQVYFESWVKEYADKDFLTGKVKRQNNPLFVKVDNKYTEREIYLISPVYEAFKEMYRAALADDVKLTITSGHRTYIEQIIEWELRWNNPRTDIAFANDVEKATYLLRYRAMPCTTRHHWGTDIDLNSFELAYYESREGQKVYNWLKANAGTFGFFQPYTVYDEERPAGFMEEKWHWSYKPLSQPMLTKYLQLVTADDIVGFKGDKAAKKLPVISDWVCGINPQLKDENL
jgi:LAS superfamily LD-carboxypeptidase LdcB